jgi:hypothetical protein
MPLLSPWQHVDMQSHAPLILVQQSNDAWVVQVVDTFEIHSGSNPSFGFQDVSEIRCIDAFFVAFLQRSTLI